MAPFTKTPSFFLFFFFIITLRHLITCNSSPESNQNDKVQELLSLQSTSESGLIPFNDQSISRFLTSVKTPRPYWIAVVFDAVHLHNKPDLRLKKIIHEFQLVSSSFITNNENSTFPSYGKLFFTKLEFSESKSSFSLFGVESLPHLRIIAPFHKNLKDSFQIDQGDWSHLAESMADFIEKKTNLQVGPIHRPPLISRKILIVIGIGFLIFSAYYVNKIIESRQTIFHNQKVWLFGALFVYFFSVSGGMHNFIRKVPVYMTDPNDRSKYLMFYRGSGMQLGVEGFCVGYFYSIVGLLLGYVTHGLVKVNNVAKQRVVMVFALLLCFWAVRWVVFLSNWKSGYAIHGYWPSRWR